MNGNDASYAELRNALRARGVWPEFTARLVELRSCDGHSLADAWRTAEVEFAPRMKPTPDAPGSDLSGIVEKDSTVAAIGETRVDRLPTLPTWPEPATPRTIAQDAQWAYQNAGRDDVTPQDAPSPGAWWLMTEAREKGVNTIIQPLMMLAKQQQDDQEELEIQKDCKRTDEELTAMIDKLIDGAIEQEDGDWERARERQRERSALDRERIAQARAASRGASAGAQDTDQKRADEPK